VRNQINWIKLEDYLNKFNKQSVIKRLGFILDLFNINQSFREKLLLILSNSFVKLDAGLRANWIVNGESK
jgi:predicted transcriptional regulator of viral defense system